MNISFMCVTEDTSHPPIGWLNSAATASRNIGSCTTHSTCPTWICPTLKWNAYANMPPKSETRDVTHLLRSEMFPAPHEHAIRDVRDACPHSTRRGPRHRGRCPCFGTCCSCPSTREVSHVDTPSAPLLVLQYLERSSDAHLARHPVRSRWRFAFLLGLSFAVAKWANVPRIEVTELVASVDAANLSSTRSHRFLRRGRRSR